MGGYRGWEGGLLQLQVWAAGTRYRPRRDGTSQGLEASLARPRPVTWLGGCQVSLVGTYSNSISRAAQHYSFGSGAGLQAADTAEAVSRRLSGRVDAALVWWLWWGWVGDGHGAVAVKMLRVRAVPDGLKVSLSTE